MNSVCRRDASLIIIIMVDAAIYFDARWCEACRARASTRNGSVAAAAAKLSTWSHALAEDACGARA